MSNTLLLLFEKESQIAQAGLELCLPKHDLEFLILLFPLPQNWDYRHCLR